MIDGSYGSTTATGSERRAAPASLFSSDLIQWLRCDGEEGKRGQRRQGQAKTSTAVRVVVAARVNGKTAKGSSSEVLGAISS